MGENKISSLQNTKVKQLVALQQKSSERRKQGVFVVEGIRELQHCLNAGYTINSILGEAQKVSSPPYNPNNSH